MTVSFTHTLDWSETHTVGIWGCFYGIQQLHVADIVQIYLFLQNNDQPLSIESDGTHAGWKGKLADGGLSLSGLACQLCGII